MTRHFLQLDSRTVQMIIVETADDIVCEMELNGLHVGWSPAQFGHVYAWFNAIISDLRENSDKCIYLFDRQHVMSA
jgi:hypothetical protein